ncbi:uncharacterized protein DMENIID0001_086410 [Sergentomyia squamirostris]
MASMDDKLAVMRGCIGLFQEPWIVFGTVRGISSRRGNLFYSHRGNDKVRACIFVTKDLNVLFLPQYSSGDLAVVKVGLKTHCGSKDIVFASAYLPYDSTDLPPTAELANLVDVCQRNSWELVIGADTNSHHIVWGSTGTNRRGESLLEFCASSPLCVLNVGNEPTFVTRQRKEVIDVTFGSPSVAELITDWHVSNDLTMSDHMRIYFDISATGGDTKRFRNPRRTDWSAFERSFCESFNGVGRPPRDAEAIEDSVNRLNSSLVSAYEVACPISNGLPSNRQSLPGDLAATRRGTRKAVNRARNTMQARDWDEATARKREYKKSLRRWQRGTYKRTVEFPKKKVNSVMFARKSDFRSWRRQKVNRVVFLYNSMCQKKQSKCQEK